MSEVLQYADIDAILEKVIRPGVTSQVSKKSTARRIFKADGEGGKTPVVMTDISMVNKTFHLPIQTGQHSGVLGYSSGAKLNNGLAALAQGQVSAKLIAGSLEMDKFTSAVKNSGVAAAGVFAQYGKMLSQGIARAENRMIANGGTSGLVGTTGGAGAATTAVTFAATTNGAIKNAKFLSVGDYVKIGGDAAVKVSAVNYAANSFTVASNQTFDAGDTIVLSDEDGNVSDDLTGIPSLVGTAAVQGVSDTAFQSQIDSTSYTAGAGALTEMDVTSLILQASEFGSPNLGLCNVHVWKILAALLTTYKTAGSIKESPVGGMKGLPWVANDQEVVICLDHDWDDARLDILDTTGFIRGVLQDLQWEDDGRGKMIRKPGYFEREAVLAGMWNIGVMNRRGQAAFTDIQG